jgi:hypothetical protein
MTKVEKFDYIGTMILVFIVSMAIVAMPSRNPTPTADAKVVWHLNYVSPTGDEYVIDSLANIGDCWQALHMQANRRGMSCERVDVVPR